MNIRRTENGVKLSAIIDGIRYAQYFIGYSIPEAVRKFKAELVNQQSNN